MIGEREANGVMSTHVRMAVGRIIYKLRRICMHYSAGEAESARPDKISLELMWVESSRNGGRLKKEGSRGRINNCDRRLGENVM